uniref:CobW C-terminal domain-containing protein n=1 Tax=Corethron hystrix TaxID=216773 RepID=A0A7S1B3K8_9STRA|mmetsp:Transcript_11536/g.25259  ORF Transcript_11536/g.25259 Transcript_11536/m.25259 type:complete len:353 (+) Transcript_11536:89-1147(+)|eukprot:CAMPEP_0113310036 /NCGR_PEP_ID=MMETSP0010_2-20120614/7839_1 /TAXON_ID=216773 ORGANISM="Corethron hystrix, Strain 308" /NCGR_SAMPLE_ID=MMETSP0010_2 /ASSEMBLY_ACC=CAM_ASM_000155 /LENGTH=352 /DNA_ID=CAMNT_0000165405 /DNA_START=54 /DNA_END=1112 /DNA_ORIENTATION=- /assembly_acc=CAM_ASM_000155
MVENTDDLTPITVVTGFLGAGKTTLVNYILKEQKTWKIAVLENEFGEVSIDTGLVAESMDAPEDLITMDNGCVCCSIRGDLLRTLGQLSKRRKDFDTILLETTGLADPAPIVYTIQTNPKMSEHYRIDSIVTLADAKHLEVHLDEIKPEGAVNEAQQQVAFADRILLNKIDLVTEEEKKHIYSRLRKINKFARVIETERSRAPLDKILKVNSFSMEGILSYDPDFFDDDDDEDAPDGNLKKKKKTHRPDLVQSVGISFAGNLHAQWFNMFMMDLLKERAADFYRTKGLLSFHGQGDTKFVFQGVHEQINFGPADKPWGKDEERVNKFVFIGKNLNRRELTKSLMECLYKYDT